MGNAGEIRDLVNKPFLGHLCVAEWQARGESLQ